MQEYAHISYKLKSYLFIDFFMFWHPYLTSQGYVEVRVTKIGGHNGA
jgi:hypothetical protein